MADIAALSIPIDSSGVLRAANDLGKFTGEANKAGSAADKLGSGSLSRMVAIMQSMDAKLGKLVSGTAAFAASQSNAAAAASNMAVNEGLAARAVEELSRSQVAASSSASALSAQQQRVAAQMAALAVVARSTGAAFQQADAHVQAFRTSLLSQQSAIAQSDAHILAYQQSMKKIPDAVKTSAGAMKANTGNIAAQFQDIGVTAAMGMNPLLIALQQGTQLSAVFNQAGGSALSSLKAAFVQILNPVSLVTIALVAGVAALVQWAAASFSAGDSAAEQKKRADELAASIRTLRETVDQETRSMGANTIARIASAEIMRKETLETLKLAEAKLILLKATRDAFQEGAMGAGPGDFSAAMGARSTGADVDELEKKVASLKSQVNDTTVSIRGLQSSIVQTTISDQFDAAAAATTRHSNTVSDLTEQYKAGKIGLDDYARAVRSSQQSLENEKKAITDAQKAGRSANRDAESAAKRAARDAERLSERTAEITRSARAEVAAQELRARSASLSAEEAAKLEQRQKAINELERAGASLTAALAAEVDALAEAYAKAKVAADVAEAMQTFQENAQKQLRAVNDATAQIGVYGDALTKLRIEQQLLNAARDAMPRGVDLSPEAEAAARGAAAMIAARENANASKQFWADMIKGADETTFALDRERTALGLTGEALLANKYVTDQLVAAKRANIALSDDDIAAIEASGAAYARTRTEIDRTREAIEFSRETMGEFFTSFFDSVREGGNVFKAFADSVINSLNRMADKLLEQGLNSLFGGGSGGGGILGSLGGLFGIGGGSSTSSAVKSIANTKAFANGGAFGVPQKFAKGGDFTNSVVRSPTLFRFANGGALGEMGEAGPEAIMPLKRGADGSLGVQMHGGDSRMHVSVSVDGNGELKAFVRNQAGAVVAESSPIIESNASRATQANIAHRQTRRVA